MEIDVGEEAVVAGWGVGVGKITEGRDVAEVWIAPSSSNIYPGARCPLLSSASSGKFPSRPAKYSALPN